MPTKEFEVWCDGYMATGEHSTAYLIGKFSGNDFDEAVESMLTYREKTDWKDIRKYYQKGGQRMVDNNDGTFKVVSHDDGHYIWACQLYDNETDARKAFG